MEEGQKAVIIGRNALLSQLIAFAIHRELGNPVAVSFGMETPVPVEPKELTQRELEIHVSTGASNDEIASQLFISPHTVKTPMYNIFRKIGVTNRLHATLWAAQNLNTVPAPRL